MGRLRKPSDVRGVQVIGAKFQEKSRLEFMTEIAAKAPAISRGSAT